MNQPYIMPAMPASELGRILVEDVLVAPDRTIRLSRPAEPEQLLSAKAVEDAYAADEYMPYWATIWPVARYMGGAILRTPFPPGGRAIEIGCGLGLPGVAALMAGLAVTFSDYDETAVRFAGDNARLNGFERFELLPMDWRHPPAATWDVLLLSDLVYEKRLVQPIADLVPKLLAPGGVALLADQNRAFAGELRQALTERGLVYETEAFEVPAEGDRKVGGTLYRIRRR